MSSNNDNLPHGPPFSRLPPCGAKNRKRERCGQPAMKNGRCRFHGGLSTGAKTKLGKERSRRGNWKHGRFSAEAKALRKYSNALIRQAKAMLG